MAAQRFLQGATNTAIAEELRVSVRSVQRWRRSWMEGGPPALSSQGPTSLPRLSRKQFSQLEEELVRGPAAHGWPDKRWTLDRIRVVIGTRFDQTYTVQGVAKLLHRHGWYCRLPAQQSSERIRGEGWTRHPVAKHR